MTYKMASDESFSVMTQSNGTAIVPDILSNESKYFAVENYPGQLEKQYQRYEVSVSNGLTSITPDNGEFLIEFTDTSSIGSFTLTQPTHVRILAIAGGGGGGGLTRRATTDTSKYGGSGGGGAGGLVEFDGIISAGVYTVDIGNGGVGGVSHTTPSSVTPGTNGGDTTILLNGESWNFPVAKGGGGGAGYNMAGLSGGSGGGGTRFNNSGTDVSYTGGNAVEGQGHAGGVGDAYQLGCGGGGAGEAGANASLSGFGGNGLSSDITGKAVYYAGGGGGGYGRSGKTGGIISGGLGGGGNGGYGKDPAGNATFYGGGGGGGSYGTANGQQAGSGYQGVVYVRIVSPAVFVWGEKLDYSDLSAAYVDQHIYLSAKGHVVGDIDCSEFGGGGSAELSSLSCLEEILSAINGGNMPMAGVNLLPYTTVSSDNGTFLLNLATNTYRMYADMDSTDAIIPTPDSSLVPQSCQYYYFEMEVAIDSTATSLVSPTGGWIWISGGELPSSGYAGHTLYISVRFDCFSRTYLANAWRVA